MSVEFVTIPGKTEDDRIHYLMVDPMNDPKLCSLDVEHAIIRREIKEWMEQNTPSGSITEDEGSAMILFKGERDASLFKLFWL